MVISCSRCPVSYPVSPSLITFISLLSTSLPVCFLSYSPLIPFSSLSLARETFPVFSFLPRSFSLDSYPLLSSFLSACLSSTPSSFLTSASHFFLSFFTSFIFHLSHLFSLSSLLCSSFGSLHLSAVLITSLPPSILLTRLPVKHHSQKPDRPLKVLTYSSKHGDLTFTLRASLSSHVGDSCSSLKEYCLVPVD